MDEDEEAKVVSVGSIGGVSANANTWRRAIDSLSESVAGARTNVASPLNVNVVYHIHTRDSPNEFDGVRTGYYSKKLNLLAVQVALPETPPPTIEEYLRGQFVAAIDAAERWARRRKVADGLTSLRDLADSLAGPDEAPRPGQDGRA